MQADIFLPEPRRRLAVFLQTLLRICFPLRAFVPRCVCAVLRSCHKNSSLCVVSPYRKQRNGSESEYTEKLQQYSKSLR